MYSVCTHVQPEDDHYQTPKHVVVPYVENTLYSTHSCVRRVRTLYISLTVIISYAKFCRLVNRLTL